MEIDQVLIFIALATLPAIAGGKSDNVHQPQDPMGSAEVIVGPLVSG